MKGFFTVLIVAAVCLTTHIACGTKTQKVIVGNRTLLSEIDCIALYPFKNLSKDKSAHLILEQLVENELVSRSSFAAVSGNDVRRQLEGIAIESLRENAKRLGQLGQKLRVQGVLTGTVFEYGYRKMVDVGEVEPFIGMQVKLYHAPTGEMVWSTSINRSSQEVSSRNRDPLSRVAILTAKQAVDLLAEQSPKQARVVRRLSCGGAR